MSWPAERKLYRRNRRIAPHEVALLVVVIGGSLLLYLFGA